LHDVHQANPSTTPAPYQHPNSPPSIHPTTPSQHPDRPFHTLLKHLPVYIRQRTTRKRVRRNTQRFKRTCEKKRTESLRKQKRHELNHHRLILQKIKQNTIKYTLARFNYLPNLSKTTHTNMKLTLGKKNPSTTGTGNILPPMANTLIGLGLKLILTSKVNTSPEEQDTTLLRFEQDFSLKVFFAGDTNDASTSRTL
jgi:hypothetical protein